MNMQEAIEQEAEWMFERMRDLGVIGGTEYAYYQGRIDSLAWISRQLDEVRV
jgi:hypothetical protein